MSKRVSLILGTTDEHSVMPFLQIGTDQYEVLRRWAALHGDAVVKSEASALRALLQVGIQALQDEMLDAGYTELASIYNGDVEQAERRTARDRYASRTDATV